MYNKKILYPIKFEEFSLAVLSCILNFKKAGTEEIVLLHVIDVAKLPMDKYEGYHPDDVKRLTGIADLKMAEAVRQERICSESQKKKMHLLSSWAPMERAMWRGSSGAQFQGMSLNIATGQCY